MGIKEILERVKKGNGFNEDHELVENGHVTILEEKVTSPMGGMAGTQYIITNRKEDGHIVVETIDCENLKGVLWRCEECEVEIVEVYKIIKK